jgi:hypothetical protein
MCQLEELIFRGIANAQVTVIAQASGLLHMEEPAIFNRAALEFLAAVYPPVGSAAERMWYSMRRRPNVEATERN